MLRVRSPVGVRARSIVWQLFEENDVFNKYANFLQVVPVPPDRAAQATVFARQ